MNRMLACRTCNVAPLMGIGALLIITAVSDGNARANAVDEFIRNEMAERHIPAISLLVARDGRILKHEAYGTANLETHAPMTRTTAAPLLSILKSFDAVAVMMLMEGGRLTLDDRVAQHLPDIPATWSSVTVRQCLAHTAGMRSVENVPGFFERIEPTNPSRTEIINLVGQLPLGAAPGERWSYNNTAYMLLEMLIEKISGRAYADFLRERVLKGLSHTTLLTRDSPVPKEITGYTWADERLVAVPPPKRVVFDNLRSTPDDLRKWMEALVQGRLVRASSLELMWSPAKLNDGSEVKLPIASGSYGLGWNLLNDARGRRVVASWGGPAFGFFAWLGYVPDDRLTVIVLANSDAAKMGSHQIVAGIARHFM
jgi:D-alanyl-D-alanine carboxypeptidase